jgi:hypothetical protein
MAVTPITVDDVLARFPVFEGQEDLIEILIPEAVRLVNDTWNATDLTSAMLYAVAHMVVSEGSADSLPVISESLGPISTSYAFDAKADPWTSTEYGRRFLALKRRNGGGASILVI